jgi:erythrin-vacuolar iron transport family protein
MVRPIPECGPRIGKRCSLTGAPAVITVTFELPVLAWIRSRFFHTGFLRSAASVTVGGVIIAAVSAALGAVG